MNEVSGKHFQNNVHVLLDETSSISGETRHTNAHMVINFVDFFLKRSQLVRRLLKGSKNNVVIAS
jgi:hypothetical protein